MYMCVGVFVCVCIFPNLEKSKNVLALAAHILEKSKIQCYPSSGPHKGYIKKQESKAHSSSRLLATQTEHSGTKLVVVLL